MSHQFLKLGLLVNDDSAILLALMDKEINKKSKKLFDFDSISPRRAKKDFRFEKHDLLRLLEALGLPNILLTEDNRKFSSIEGLCILLKRLAYPNRLHDNEEMFNRSSSAISLIFNRMINFVYERFSHLVTSWDQWWLRKESLRKYADAIQRKGAPLDGCFGFIDATIHRICRPESFQRETYSGHKRVHCLKYQSIVVANGLIANLHGPEPGRRHDSYMLKQSNILRTLEDIIGADQLYLYGDKGYPLKRHLITPYQGSNLTPEQLQFNKRMAVVRISVEWEFGGLFNQFAFLRYSKNQKLFLQPVGKYVIVATILRNCQTCLYGNETSSYFNCDPPTLEQYLLNSKDL